MIVTRFAPSPTGLLHLGHAFAAITACEAGEQFIVRIEDIDASRCREEYVAAIFEDLAWLGLDWLRPVMRQSDRGTAYRAALKNLETAGLVYPCFCTRKEIADEIVRSLGAPQGVDGPIYPGTCRHLDAETRRARINSGAPYALRLDVAKGMEITGPLTFQEDGKGPKGEHGAIAVHALGDVILARKDAAAYHLAVVVDDAHQEISLVTRGNDLFASTHLHRLLQRLLGLPEPRYAHHRLIVDALQKKLSKRDGALTLRALRAAGATPRSVRNQLGL